MRDYPHISHTGLAAQQWEMIAGGDDVPFYRARIQRYGEPALDCGCGAGRVLRQLLSEGVDVDGLDVSSDMIALCAEIAEREGLRPTLYRQAFHEMDLPRSYRTIMIPGSFGLSATREQDLEALGRMHAHLAPGGALVFDYGMDYQSPSWQYWTREGRKHLPGPWGAAHSRIRARDGAEFVNRWRTLDVDPVDQAVWRQVHYEVRLDGVTVQAETHTMRVRCYLMWELTLMLRLAGFEDVEVTGDYTDEPATRDHDTLVFTARKSA
ncbi:class I SAM-dependent methyltransferase [Candidatus Poribacteria bacterium]|jgi:SAM-dependent methyltransferase|nr:class I SAM-dependent methyltransferase [Candidatus Poribacteria bacterium]MBT5532869.1 class I SAM-dependent methyltransferase [Candidatus Poribacteria bacterium]MBT5709872.1 class I SAM-dependent methyltransferase [Candidatus Poribacteria bacterium]MBT7804544.1 class I SAM-dependent methyltransferase [Candidatus Poribacteria bacterium]